MFDLRLVFVPPSQARAMSDREGHSGAPPADDDLSLPKATVAKMIAGTHMVPLPRCVEQLQLT